LGGLNGATLFSEYDCTYKDQDFHIYRKGKYGEIYIAENYMKKTSDVKFCEIDACENLISKQKIALKEAKSWVKK